MFDTTSGRRRHQAKQSLSVGNAVRPGVPTPREACRRRAAMVHELDRSFVPEIEKAAGPSPAWYQPTSYRTTVVRRSQTASHSPRSVPPLSRCSSGCHKVEHGGPMAIDHPYDRTQRHSSRQAKLRSTRTTRGRRRARFARGQLLRRVAEPARRLHRRPSPQFPERFQTKSRTWIPTADVVGPGKNRA